MDTYIHSIATAVPDTVYTQPYARDFMKRHVAQDRRTARTLHQIYTHSGIEKRHSVIPDFAPDAPGGLFFDASTNTLRNPGTGARNACYAQETERILQSLFALADEPLQPSRDTLRDYGNMSSATVLFVLDRILRTPRPDRAPLITMAFGPGLTIEYGLLEYVPAARSVPTAKEPAHELLAADA